jgi:hypothetical protein
LAGIAGPHDLITAVCISPCKSWNVAAAVAWKFVTSITHSRSISR